MPKLTVLHVQSGRGSEPNNVRYSPQANNIMPFESSVFLSKEADVVAASTSFVMRGIYDILHILWPGQWDYQSEVSDTNVRYDLIFRQKVDGKREDPIAIIEYKKIDMIRLGDFSGALVQKGPSIQQINDTIKKTQDPDMTLLLRTALAYSKQVSTYSRHLDCPYVALFNRDHLLLYKFDLADTQPSFTAGQRAEIVWVDENSQTNNYTQSSALSGKFSLVGLW
jgi:hypothetical protein